MRLSLVVLALCLGLTLAVPAPKKLEKKSIPDDTLTAAAPKTIEPVDQKLDEPKLNDEALKEDAGDKVGRAKKQASTTFCVEIRQNKPTQVDCDELNNRPQSPPQPPSVVIPEPQEPLPPPPPPQEQPSDYGQVPSGSGGLPCEPEIAAYLVEPSGEVGYYYTGNCAQHVPALVHVPSGGLPVGNTGVYGIPAGGLGAFGPGLPFFNVPHGLPGAGGIPTATVPTGGTPMTIQITPGTPGGSAVVPLQPGATPLIPAAGIPGLHGQLHAHPLIHGHPLNLNGLHGGASPLNNLHFPIHGGVPLQDGSASPTGDSPAGGAPGGGSPAGGAPGGGAPTGGSSKPGLWGHHHHPLHHALRPHLHAHLHHMLPGPLQCTCQSNPLTMALSKAAAAQADGSDPNGTALKLLQSMAFGPQGKSADDYTGMSKDDYAQMAKDDYAQMAKEGYPGSARNDYTGMSKDDYAQMAKDGYPGSARNDYTGMSKDDYAQMAKNGYPGMARNDYTGMSKDDYAQMAKDGLIGARNGLAHKPNLLNGRYNMLRPPMQQQNMGGPIFPNPLGGSNFPNPLGGLSGPSIANTLGALSGSLVNPLGALSGMSPISVNPFGTNYPLYTGPFIRGSSNCPMLADSFQAGSPIQGLRMSRGDDAESKDKDKEKTKEPEQKDAAGKAEVSSTAENSPASIDARNSEEVKSARVARLLSPADIEANKVETK